MIPEAGEIWLADNGSEIRRPVFVLSGARFQRLAERVVVAPVLDSRPEVPRPWHVSLSEERTVAVHQLATLRLDRLLSRLEPSAAEPLHRARRAARAIVG